MVTVAFKKHASYESEQSFVSAIVLAAGTASRMGNPEAVAAAWVRTRSWTIRWRTCALAAE